MDFGAKKSKAMVSTNQHGRARGYHRQVGQFETATARIPPAEREEATLPTSILAQL